MSRCHNDNVGVWQFDGERIDIEGEELWNGPRLDIFSRDFGDLDGDGECCIDILPV